MPPDAAQVVVEYTCGLEPASLTTLCVVGPDHSKRQFGDAAPSAAYSAAYRERIQTGPLPLVCLVGPYGYSAAFSSANTARNELQRHQLNPDDVSLHNTGRAFLGLGAIAAAIATSGATPAQVLNWLDEGATQASMWVVARTQDLERLEKEVEFKLEAPGGLPADEYTLLRVRLSSRVMGGFRSAASALEDAARRTALEGPAVALLAPGLGCPVDDLGRVARASTQIEPGEIETVLQAHPAVDVAVVDAHSDGTRTRLVAYLVGAALPSTADLRAYLGDRLPDYLVPAAFVPLAQLPTTSSGKLDRRALPEPQLGTDTEQIAPSTKTETVLAEIWAKALGLDRVGVPDNLELGGDSILSIEIVSKARQRGLLLHARDMFRYQTIADLAATVERTTTDELDRQPVLEPAPLGPIQRWFFDTYGALGHFSMSMLLALDPDLDRTALRAALTALVGTHEALRTRFVQVAGEWRQEVTPATPVDLRIVDADRLANAALAAQESLDPTTGVVFAAVLDDSGRLFLTAHHLVVDGVSWRILLGDLETAYRQALAGEPVVLPPVGTPVVVERPVVGDDVGPDQVGDAPRQILLLVLLPAAAAEVERPHRTVSRSAAGRSGALVQDRVGRGQVLLDVGRRQGQDGVDALEAVPVRVFRQPGRFL